MSVISGPNQLPLEFARLSDLPQLVQACAKFHAVHSGDDSDWGLEMRRSAFQKLSLDGEDEDAIVCYFSEGERTGEVAGIAAVIEAEMAAFEDLGPWLSGLMIHPDCHETGLKQMLCRETEELAGDLGYEQIFVQTKDTTFYKTQDFAEIEAFKKDNAEHWVLGKAL